MVLHHVTSGKRWLQHNFRSAEKWLRLQCCETAPRQRGESVRASVHREDERSEELRKRGTRIDQKVIMVDLKKAVKAAGSVIVRRRRQV
jgi:hypothetical protein